MKKWHVDGAVVGRLYVGTIEAETQEEAIEKAWKMYHAGKVDGSDMEWDVEEFDADEAQS